MIKYYIKCLIEWQDDKSQEEVVIKTTHDFIEDEDDKIFFYGLSLDEIIKCKLNGLVCENEWKILEILDIMEEL